MADRSLSKSKRKCSIESCESPHRAKGYCSIHYKEAKRKGALSGPTCSVEGCEKPVNGRGLCASHYHHAKVQGELPDIVKLTPEEKFLSMHEVCPETGCWNWVKGTDTCGYGIFYPYGAAAPKIRAHRYSYMIHKGPIPEGLYVCHTCDNPGCVNPDHLWLGTHTENMRDKERKGRGHDRSGSSNVKAKITEEIALEIYNAEGTNKEIGARFGLDHQLVYRIRTKRMWKHIHKIQAETKN